MGKTKNADSLLLILLFAWWVANIIQAAFTGLANDEAYYWMFARSLDWGYFDHPPMTAVLLKAGDFIGGELGIRFFFTILQPLYLYILWRLIRPENPTRHEALLFFMISFSMPVLQLYGFIAVPDSPLMLASILFLWSYDRFCKKDSWDNLLLMGGMMALLAYSKYQGALMVLFTFASNPKTFKNPKLYLSGIVTLLLFLPHLMWQYNHDWASFHYHLAGRNGYFRWNYIAEFWLNLLLIFNPLFVYLFFKGWGKGDYADKHVRHALYTIAAGFVIFFTLSSLRGYVQPQWVIPITFSLIMIAFGWCRTHERAGRYAIRVGWVMIALFALVRIEMIFNPVGAKFEVFDNKPSYEAIAEVADGRPVIFSGNYSVAAKYIYYTGGTAYCQPNINYRTSQWQFLDMDRKAAGQDVIVEVKHDGEGKIKLANGKNFEWVTVHDFRPVREVGVKILGEIPEKVTHGERIDFDVELANPYDYDITVSPETLPLEIVWGRNKETFNEYIIDIEPFAIPAGGICRKSFSFVVPQELDKPEYRVGFIIKCAPLESWFNSREFKIAITE